jgi:arabinose-5-phosphate isomerase
MARPMNVLSTNGQTKSQVSVIDPLARDARDCFKRQAAAIASLADRLEDGAFSQAVGMLFRARGHVIVTGLGKSGLVGQKISATLASTGTPSFFLHATEALHGELGAVTDDDAVLLITYSGETEEVVSLLPHLRRRKVPTVAMTGQRSSTVARGVDVHLDVSVDEELCPHNLAPTNSTLAALAMGDALAISLSRLRGFHEDDFARLHPGGSLGRRLHAVADAMVRTPLPTVEPGARLADCALAMARGRLPMVLVMDGTDLHGVVTEAALRAALEAGAALDAEASTIVDRDPPVVEERTPLGKAELRMQREGIEALLVVDAQGLVAGIVAAEA